MAAWDTGTAVLLGDHKVKSTELSCHYATDGKFRPLICSRDDGAPVGLRHTSRSDVFAICLRAGDEQEHGMIEVH